MDANQQNGFNCNLCTKQFRNEKALLTHQSDKQRRRQSLHGIGAEDCSSAKQSWKYTKDNAMEFKTYVSTPSTRRNTESKETKKGPQDFQQNPWPPQDFPAFIPEEVRNLEEDITILLLSQKSACKTAKEISAVSSKKKSINERSLSFLLKKTFVCTPCLRDSLQESRMEKLLRTRLHKKMCRQNSSRASFMKKYLKGKDYLKAGEEEEGKEEIMTLNG